MEAWRVDPTMFIGSVKRPTEIEFMRRFKDAKAFYSGKQYLTSPKHHDSLEAYKVWWCKRNNINPNEV